MSIASASLVGWNRLNLDRRFIAERHLATLYTILNANGGILLLIVF